MQLNGHLEVVKLLLANDKVDPGADSNYAIKWASNYGHLEVVKLLLANDKVDPSADNNSAILSAYQKGHLEVVKLLIPQTDLSKITDQKILAIAKEMSEAETLKKQSECSAHNINTTKSVNIPLDTFMLSLDSELRSHNIIKIEKSGDYFLIEYKL